MRALKRLIAVLLVLVIVVPVAFGAMIYSGLAKMHDSSINTSDLKNLKYGGVEGIKNILLLGTDEREGETQTRSDAMMILTIDTVHDSLKLTSLARDAYVTVPGHGKTKLTHAYAFGGPELLIKTIEDNFRLDINDYARVNFESFMDIIDALGGITVDVKQSEINETNKFINETYNWYKSKHPDVGPIEYIQNEGTQKLNSYQALSFSRIRKNDNAFERDRRQRDVMQAIMSGIKNAPKYKYPFLFKAIMPYMKTNMTPTQMMGYGLKIIKLDNTDIKQMEFPIPDDIHSFGGIYGRAGWVLRFKPSSVDILHDFIFKDIQYKGVNQ